MDGSDLTPLLTRTGKSLTQLKVLEISYNKLTDAKGLEKLTQLKTLWLRDNPDPTILIQRSSEDSHSNPTVLHNPPELTDWFYNAQLP